METGIITNIQRYSLHDGPGIRTTVFLKGCPLDCWWCHNPEGRSPRREVLVVETRCLRCGECIEACPEDGSPAMPNAVLLPPETCGLCGTCVEACPTGARQMMGRTMTEAEVMAEILRDRMFYEESGGGVTFSGGEPLMQAGLVRALLQRCRSSGIHASLDTCGFAPEATLLETAELARLVLFDVKFVDDALHQKYTGVSNSLILSNLRALCRRHPQVWIRVPVIPGVNDTPGHLEAMARMVAELGAVHQVNLLPYHQTGIAKFKRLGEAYRLKEVNPPDPSQMEAAAAAFSSQGLTVKIGG
jgi:pyruvate formate lyase activating enzyme